jgi:uncharacterized protein YcnI
MSAVSGALALVVASPASAHIDPDPTEAQAGASLSIAFTVEHGCDGSPTTQLDMRLPDGVTSASPDPVDGWDASIEDNVVTFAGGPLPDDQEGTFSVTMTLPPTPDTTIYFPFVQRCEEGEIRWIGIPSEPGDELDEPAPALLLIGPVASTTAPSPETTVAPTEPTATVPVTEPAAAPAPPTTASVATTEPEPTSQNVDEDADPNTGTWFFIASVAAVLGLGTFVAFRARSARRARDAAAP